MLTHSAFHVQIQLHTLTVYAGCVDELFGDVFLYYFFFPFFFFYEISHYFLFCSSSQDLDGLVLWRNRGEGVGIHFSQPKWFYLKI